MLRIDTISRGTQHFIARLGLDATANISTKKNTMALLELSLVERQIPLNRIVLGTVPLQLKKYES